jgi:hypothetical protein
MKITILILVAFLTGCVSGADSKITTEYGSDGNPLRSTQKLSGNDYVDGQIEKTRQKCYSGKGAESTDPLVAAIKSMGDALKVSHGWRECAGSMNSNERKVAQSQERHRTARSLLGSALRWAGMGFMVKEAGNVIGNLSDGKGVNVTGNNNSLRGNNAGDSNTAGYTEQVPIFDPAIEVPEVPELPE